MVLNARAVIAPTPSTVINLRQVSSSAVIVRASVLCRSTGSGETGHAGRVTGRMPDGVNDDLGLRGLVENEIGVRRRRHPTDGRIVGAAADLGMQQQKVGEGLNAGLNPPRAPRRMGRDVIEDRAKVGEGRRV